MSAQDPVIAKPSDTCCTVGTLHEGEPRGRFETIANVETYVTTPPEGKANGHILLYFPDVWGFFNNGFLVMDGFANEGFLTLGLDYFRGDPVWKHRKSRDDTTTEPGFDFEAWKDKHRPFANENSHKWALAVKEKYGKANTKFACVGYCFGAPYVCDELASDVCAAGAFAHPAFLKEHHFTNLQRPLFMSCAQTDHTFPPEFRNRAVAILDAAYKPYHLQLFSGVQHGFALRCDLNKPYERYCKEQSLKGIADYLNFHLAQG